MGLHAPSASLATMAKPWPGTVGVSVTKISLMICIAIILSQLSTVFTKSALVLGLGIRCLLLQIELLIEMIMITRMWSHVFGLCAPVHQAVHV